MNRFENKKKIMKESDRKLKHCFIKQKMSTVLSCLSCLAVVAQLSFFSLGCKLSQDTLSKFKETDDYKTKIEIQTNQVIQEYKDGEITLKEFSTKINDLDTRKHTINELKQSNNNSAKLKMAKVETYYKITAELGLGIIAGTATSLLLSKSAKKDESDSVDLLFGK